MRIKEIWDDYIVWYCVDIPKKIYKDIRHWCHTCGRFKSHWHFANYSMFHCYPWDFNYFLRIQYEWIKKSQQYFNNTCYCSEEKLNEINRYQKICLGLIEIMLDDRDYWHWDDKNKKSVCDIYINLRNKHRFPYRGIDFNGKSCMSTDIYDKYPEEYYKYKAKYLYFKILRDFADNWWD